MSNEDEIMELFEIVRRSFLNATKHPDMGRWKSCAMLAGVASVRAGVDGDLFRAAVLEGVAAEAIRKMRELQAIRTEEIAA